MPTSAERPARLRSLLGQAVLVLAFAGFSLGGLAAGWRGLGALATLAQRPITVSAAIGPAHGPADDRAFAAVDARMGADGAPRWVEQAAPTPPPASPKGRLTILLLGLDQRPDQVGSGGDPGRTDSLTLVSLDFDQRTASLASIPRDGLAAIPGYGTERVNAAYTLGELGRRGGGPALAKQTVAQLFGVPVNRYALVNVHPLERLVDQLGGVWVDNPRRLVDTAFPDDTYGTITLDIPAGRQLMDGRTAVQYARTRHADSDFGRQERQQQVLLAIRDRAVALDVVPRLPGLLPVLDNLVQTDLSPAEILQLADFGRGLDRQRDIASLRPDPDLTPTFTGAGGAAYIDLTPAYRAAVKRMITQPRGAPAATDAPAPTAADEAPQPRPAVAAPVPVARPGRTDAVIFSGGLGAILRGSPITGPRIDVLPDGAPLEVLERRQTPAGEWVRVRSAEGEEGWLSGRVVDP